MAGRRKVGNLLALAVLSYLTHRPMHPYELGRMLRDNGDERSIKFNQGSLYMVVQQLTRAGFITELSTSRDGRRPERTVYGLTDLGRQEQRAWLRGLVEEPQHEYPQLVAALSLIGALTSDEALVLLRRRVERLADQRAEIRELIDSALGQGVHALFLVEEDYRLAMLDAERAFVQQLVEKITEPQGGWARVWAELNGRPDDAHAGSEQAARPDLEDDPLRTIESGDTDGRP